MLDEVGLSDAGRADEDDVLFRVLGFLGADGVLGLEFTDVIDVVVVIADRDREHFFRFVLLDDKAVEMGLDVAREKIEDELIAARRRGRFLVVAFLGALGLGEAGERNLLPEVRFHELGELALQFFRCWEWRVLIQWTKT